MNYLRREQGKKKVRRILRVWRATRPQSAEWFTEDSRIAQLMLRTRHPCSRICCGNRRRYDGATRQEKIADAP